MDDTAKYLIHADITADGVVERSDVVGAVFGQTEGLLGDELDLRDLQQSSKVGRIDVEIHSEQGSSRGEITIASSLDKVETATLAAALETITRVGPCRSAVEVTNIEDVRAAKRREVVERAQELLEEAFDDSVMSSEEILAEVREHVRVEDITEYEGLPAGPRVGDSDALVVVEGRADVLTLLRYGVKNAIAVEGTNVPEAVTDLTRTHTVTAFLDADRGGDLILKELAQVADVDYVAIAPAGKSVEDLTHHEVFEALREKIPYETIATEDEGAVAATDGSASPAPPESAEPLAQTTPERPSADAAVGDDVDGKPADGDGEEPDASEGTADGDSVGDDATSAANDAEIEEDAASHDDTEEESLEDDTPATLQEHVRVVVGEGSKTVRFLDEAMCVVDEFPAREAFDSVAAADPAPAVVVVDGEVSQRLLDVAAQRGVERVVGRTTGEFTKRPTGVRVLTADQLLV